MTDEDKKKKRPRSFHVECANMTEAINGLTDEEAAAILREMIYFGDTGERKNHFEDHPAARAIFGILLSGADEFREKYYERCDQNRENIKQRWKNQKQGYSKGFDI